jgi:hypothetical protein
MAKPLSPAAQAVLRADAGARCVSEWASVNDPPCHPSDNGWNGCFDCVNRSAVAAALRAAADEVVPLGYEDVWTDGKMLQYEKRDPVREQLLAIATELENQ